MRSIAHIERYIRNRIFSPMENHLEVYTLTGGSLNLTSRPSLETAHARAVAGGMARAVADARAVARAVTGVVYAGAVASVVDAG